MTDALGDPEAAEPHFLRALQLDANSAQGHLFYARWLTQQKRSPRAIAHLKRAFGLSPGLAATSELLMDLYYLLGARTDLNLLVEEVLRVSPGSSQRRSLPRRRDPLLVGPGLTGLLSTGCGSDKQRQSPQGGDPLQAGPAIRPELTRHPQQPGLVPGPSRIL